MQPEIELFGLTLYTFGMMVGLAFIAAGWVALLGVSLAQFVSLAMIAAGVAWLLSLRRTAPERAERGRVPAVAGRGRR